LLTVSLVVAAFMALPAVALGSVDLSITRNLTTGAGGVGAHSIPNCSYIICFPVPPPPITLTVSRGDVQIGSAGPTSDPFIAVQLRQGDVVDISDGTNRMTLTFDGRPSLDDYSCALVGRTSVSGSFTTSGSNPYGSGVSNSLLGTPGQLDNIGGDRVLGESYQTGDRFMANFPRAIRRGDAIRIEALYTPDGFVPVSSQMEATICPVPPPTCISSLKKDPDFGGAFRDTVSDFARHGARRLLASGRSALELWVCDPGRFRARVTARGGVVVAKGSKKFDGQTTSVLEAPTVLRLTRGGRQRLEALRDHGVRAVPVRLTIRLYDATGDSLTRSRRVRLSL